MYNLGMSSETPQLTYDAIQTEVEAFAATYRAENKIPELPAGAELAPYQTVLTKYPLLVDQVKAYVAEFDSDSDHGFEHLIWVSALARWICNFECNELKLEPDHKEYLIEQTVLAGFLHDIDRHLGFGEAHQVEGAKTAERMLASLGLHFPNVIATVANHDKINFYPGVNQDLAIIIGSVFDADHFRYGLEREDNWWQNRKKMGIKPEDVIHLYDYLPQYLHAWKTIYGKQVGPDFLQFGLAIAKHIEEKFSTK